MASFSDSSHQQQKAFDPFNDTVEPNPKNSFFNSSPTKEDNSSFANFESVAKALPAAASPKDHQQQQRQQEQQRQRRQSEDFFLAFDAASNAEAPPSSPRKSNLKPSTPRSSSNPSTPRSTPSSVKIEAPFNTQRSTEFDSIFATPSTPNSGKSPSSRRRRGGSVESVESERDSFRDSSFFDRGSDLSAVSPQNRGSRSQTNTEFDMGFSANSSNSGGFVENDNDCRWRTKSESTLREVSDEENDDDDDGDKVDMTLFRTDPTAASSVVSGSYSIVFESEKKLGMLLERLDTWVNNASNHSPAVLKEATVVKLIVENGAADVKGVKLGSIVAKVNDIDCTNISYLEALNVVKTTPRPITIIFQQGQLSASECVSGYCLTRKSVGTAAPSLFSTWKRRYFVLGGAIANKDVLQVYRSKADYERIVVSLFEKRPIDIKLKAYKLIPGFKLSNIKQTNYSELGDVGGDIHYFCFKPPKANFKSIKFASDNAMHLADLHRHMKHFL